MSERLRGQAGAGGSRQLASRGHPALELAPSSASTALAQIPPAGVRRGRKRAALAVAAACDLAQWALLPVASEGAASLVEVALDVTTVRSILLSIVGFQWRLAIALIAELVPGLDMFPTWTAVVLSLPTAVAPEAAPRLPG